MIQVILSRPTADSVKELSVASHALHRARLRGKDGGTAARTELDELRSLMEPQGEA